MVKDIVSAHFGNCMGLENFDKVRGSSTDNTKKGIAFNILEVLLTLYFRFHFFSFVKYKIQAFKEIAKNKSKISHQMVAMKKSTSFTF